MWSLKRPHTLKQLLNSVPDTVTAFHWHGDTFDIPSDAIGFATSVACINQGFAVDTSIVGLQFHLETTTDSIHEMIKHCKGELVEGQWIQGEETIQTLYRATEEQNHNLMEQLYLNLSRI